MTSLHQGSRRPYSTSRAASGIAIGALLLAASLFPGGCSGSSDGTSVCAELGDACGGECTFDQDCPSGTHCGAGDTCTAECTTDGSQCGLGRHCNSLGQCEDGEGGSGGSGVGGFGGGSTGGTGGSGCIDEDVKFEPQTPTVVLLVDQSGSMSEKFAGTTRWNAVYDALFDMPSGVVFTLEDKVRFGLSLYTSHGGFKGGECPILTEQSVALGNYNALEALYSASDPDGDTPTGESITAVAAELAQVTEPGDKAIVLATDGEPDNCTDADAHDASSQKISVDAATAAFGQGIRTYVIAVGSDISDAHLQDVANAGTGTTSGPDAPFWKANDQAGLIDAFNTIIEGVRSCIFDLNGTVAMEAQSKGNVRLDGETLAQDDPNGWQLNSPSQVELVGDACEAIKSGDHDIKISFPCGSITPR
ncbi:MAG: VWA domain-containing protein [Myxococcales bacterium]|nr:VWA domain-containing protein [Myxococcales bacterium]